jgi:hypothetical protein
LGSRETQREKRAIITVKINVHSALSFFGNQPNDFKNTLQVVHFVAGGGGDEPMSPVVREHKYQDVAVENEDHTKLSAGILSCHT